MFRIKICFQCCHLPALVFFLWDPPKFAFWTACSLSGIHLSRSWNIPQRFPSGKMHLLQTCLVDILIAPYWIGIRSLWKLLRCYSLWWSRTLLEIILLFGHGAFIVLKEALQSFWPYVKYIACRMIVPGSPDLTADCDACSHVWLWIQLLLSSNISAFPLLFQLRGCCSWHVCVSVRVYT